MKIIRTKKIVKRKIVNRRLTNVFEKIVYRYAGAKGIPLAKMV